MAAPPTPPAPAAAKAPLLAATRDIPFTPRKDRLVKISTLRDALLTWVPPRARELDVDCVNVLIAGPPGAGKSEVINNLWSALMQQGRYVVGSGPALETNTTTLLHWQLHGDLIGNMSSKFVLWDTPGWPYDRSAGALAIKNYHPEVMDYLLDGKLAHGTEYDGLKPLEHDESGRIRGFIPNPTFHQKPHVLVMVFSVNQLGAVGVAAVATTWAKAARQRGLKVLALITQFDKDYPQLAHQPEGVELDGVYRLEELDARVSPLMSMMEIPLYLFQRNVPENNGHWFDDRSCCYYLMNLYNLYEILKAAEARFAKEWMMVQQQNQSKAPRVAAPAPTSAPAPAAIVHAHAAPKASAQPKQAAAAAAALVCTNLRCKAPRTPAAKFCSKCGVVFP